MRTILKPCLALILIIVLLLQVFSSFALPKPAQTIYSLPPSQRTVVPLNEEWKFHKGDEAGAESSLFEDSSWESIHLPHTWNGQDGQDGGNNYYRGTGWYRRHFKADSKLAGKRFYLQFDGANTVTKVYVNGQYVGNHEGGYSAFRFDVTPYMKTGEDNVISVAVSNAADPDIPPLSADYTFFGGIYRDVSLLVTDPLQIDAMDYGSPGVYLKQTNVGKLSADLQVNTEVCNFYSSVKNVTINTVITDAKNQIVRKLSTSERLEGNSRKEVIQNMAVANPHLWDGLDDPYLYAVNIEVGINGKITDCISQPLGFRYFSVDANQGFFLNGRSYDLHGVSRHQDRPGKGWAISSEDQQEDFNLIREIGCTAVRLAHYPQSEYFYDLCDQNGMIVWAELALINKITESAGFYESAKEQLKELIRQNYNHPSILFWSISNEIENVAGPSPGPLLDQLNLLAHEEDSTRLTTTAAVNDHPIAFHADLAGFNKYFGWYYGEMNDFGKWADGVHKKYPLQKIGVSEYGAGGSIQYHTEAPPKKGHTEEYENVYHENQYQQMKGRGYLWCKFVWNMFDFASDAKNEGDTPGRNDKGLVTYDRKIKKDSFFFYKANWTKEPFVYITSRRFTDRTSPVTEVKIYSNCETVEVKVNGTSLGMKKSGDVVFQWEGVGLSRGENTIEAVGTCKGQIYTDQCGWNLK